MSGSWNVKVAENGFAVFSLSAHRETNGIFVMFLTLMRKALLLLPLFLCVSFARSFAQYYTNENKIWIFGKNAGLDFSTWSPIPFKSAISTSEGSAVVCNSSGHLLFYTDGKRVYNKNHQLMPSGGSIVSYETGSTTQAALIVQVIGQPGNFYVFSLENQNGTNSSELQYCIVDMSFSSGLGNVNNSTVQTPIEDSLAEKMIAITGNSDNIWLLVHKKDTNIFLTYNITSAGISNIPIISNVGSFAGKGAYAVGTMKVSLNRRRIVSQTYKMPASTNSGTEVYDFDPNTGFVSDCMVLDSVSSTYGAEFSPDNTKLYSQEEVGSQKAKIYQYDLSLASVSDIRLSKTELASLLTTNFTDMKLAPNHKIYFVGDDTVHGGQYLDCISAPNLAGTACGHQVHAVQLAENTWITGGLPNLYVTTDTLAWAEVNMTSILPDISLHPNPAVERLSISSSMDIDRVGIFDLTGREVYNATCGNKIVTIDVSTLPDGVYFVNINGSVTRSFVKR